MNDKNILPLLLCFIAGALGAHFGGLGGLAAVLIGEIAIALKFL